MSSKSSSPAPAPSPLDTARAQLQAQIETLGPAAQNYYNVLSNPNYGILPTTQLYEQTRNVVNPEETKVRNQLTQNILAALQSPTGITPDQQAHINQSRDFAQNKLVEAMRNRANLGGGLYGGRSAASEAESVGQLQNQFAESDINRETQARLNAIQSALPLLQLLYPDVNITNPQFLNPTPSGDNAYSGALQARGQDLQYQAQQQANQSALYSALFQGLGTAAGGYLGRTK